jgi:hypothetical protein
MHHEDTNNVNLGCPGRDGGDRGLCTRSKPLRALPVRGKLRRPWARYGHAERLGPQSCQRNWRALVNEIGVPSRAWVDWPGHIWAQSWNEGAIYSPDGMTIQFDRGTVWHRILPQPVLHSGG